jgi:hypothetical protein
MDMPSPAVLGLSGWGYTDFHASVNFAFWAFSEVGGLSLLSDYGDRAMGVPYNSIRDTAHQSPP